jgi:hypothetical protein
MGVVQLNAKDGRPLPATLEEGEAGRSLLPTALGGYMVLPSSPLFLLILLWLIPLYQHSNKTSQIFILPWAVLILLGGSMVLYTNGNHCGIEVAPVVILK